MEYKLKAISNNIDNDRIIDMMLEESSNNSASGKWESKTISTNHICEKNVPVLYSTLRGVYLRKFNKSSANNYSIDFCDLERWNYRKNHMESIGLTPPSTSSDKSSTFQSVKPIKIVRARSETKMDEKSMESPS
ncbi:unnamed protein product [Chironomus riparius]|uniref:Uncharacterized protein n=1 Tax=Chironomus riparius TaxID=315576 RepID=A0A9N9WUB7_9DIPT|nr:unnamed protein product [Chironomus riparius]